MSSALLADLLLILHVAIVLFIVGGLALIAVGGALRWGGARSEMAGYHRLQEHIRKTLD